MKNNTKNKESYYIGNKNITIIKKRTVKEKKYKMYPHDIMALRSIVLLRNTLKRGMMSRCCGEELPSLMDIHSAKYLFQKGYRNLSVKDFNPIFCNKFRRNMPNLIDPSTPVGFRFLNHLIKTCGFAMGTYPSIMREWQSNFNGMSKRLGSFLSLPFLAFFDEPIADFKRKEFQDKQCKDRWCSLGSYDSLKQVTQTIQDYYGDMFTLDNIIGGNFEGTELYRPIYYVVKIPKTKELFIIIRGSISGSDLFNDIDAASAWVNTETIPKSDEINLTGKVVYAIEKEDVMSTCLCTKTDIDNVNDSVFTKDAKVFNKKKICENLNEILLKNNDIICPPVSPKTNKKTKEIKKEKKTILVNQYDYSDTDSEREDYTDGYTLNLELQRSDNIKTQTIKKQKEYKKNEIEVEESIKLIESNNTNSDSSDKIEITDLKENNNKLPVSSTKNNYLKFDSEGKKPILPPFIKTPYKVSDWGKIELFSSEKHWTVQVGVSCTTMAKYFMNNKKDEKTLKNRISYLEGVYDRKYYKTMYTLPLKYNIAYSEKNPCEKEDGVTALPGMLKCAYNIFNEVKEILETYKNQGYILNVTGHSLGSGVAAILSYLIHRTNSWDTDPMHKKFVSHGFGVPPCLSDKAARVLKDIGHISVVYDNDAISRINFLGVQVIQHRLDAVKSNKLFDPKIVARHIEYGEGISPLIVPGNIIMVQPVDKNDVKTLIKFWEKNPIQQNHTLDIEVASKKSLDELMSNGELPPSPFDFSTKPITELMSRYGVVDPMNRKRIAEILESDNYIMHFVEADDFPEMALSECSIFDHGEYCNGFNSIQHLYLQRAELQKKGINK